MAKKEKKKKKHNNLPNSALSVPMTWYLKFKPMSLKSLKIWPACSTLLLCGGNMQTTDSAEQLAHKTSF